jgi:hypothetical protein
MRLVLTLLIAGRLASDHLSIVWQPVQAIHEMLMTTCTELKLPFSTSTVSEAER